MPSSWFVAITFLLVTLVFFDSVDGSATSFTKRMSLFKSLKSLGSKSKRNKGVGEHYLEPSAGGNAAVPFWMERIKHQGRAPFHPDAQYRVFRNVKDYGAVGDGVSDDTDAINRAIVDQNRCGGGNCRSSTISPAIVYFPQGTYLISKPIIPYYYTQLIGDAKMPPTLLASSSFTGMAIIDVNPYIPGGNGAQWFGPTNTFFRSIRNFIIDVRRVPANKTDGTGIHWQVAQATSLINIVFEMSRAPNTAHQGIWMENGSGGFMGDLVFNGGKFGIWGGNQQFTVRNITVNGAQTAVYSLWNWGWTYQDVKVNDCQVGFDIQTRGNVVDNQSTGAQAIIDVEVSNTPIFVRTSQPSFDRLAGSIVLNNIRLVNVPVAVGVLNGGTILTGTSPGSTTRVIDSWIQGNVYHDTDHHGMFFQGEGYQTNKPSSLLTPDGKIVGRGHPQYEDADIEDIVSVRDFGAVGDGKTDDTLALQSVLDKFARDKIIFLDAGFYILTSTLRIPTGTRLVGEAWSVLAGRGTAFDDQYNPEVVVRVGERNVEHEPRGSVEITDVVFTTVGPAAGAIVVEWNVGAVDDGDLPGGLWDSHIRLGGSAGTNLDGNTCSKFGIGSYDPCYAAFLGLHITPRASGYFEGTWVWLADHDLDIQGEAQITVYSGRGILSESQGPVWMIGTASEHHVIYQYNLACARDHYMGLIQTESPYFQPKPASPTPFCIDERYHDPSPYFGNAASWALNINNSKDILVFGAGLYSFFVNYGQDCIKTRNCQEQILNIDPSSSSVYISSLSTVASTYQVSVGGKGIVREKDNVNGFASTVTVWKSD